MYAVEFQTNIQDGTIEVPKEYRNKVRGAVRVIILTEEHRGEENFIEYLMNNPIQAPGFTPMKREDIYER
jgi:hypothetical protein